MGRMWTGANLHLVLSSAKRPKKAWKMRKQLSTSATPIVSRIECIERQGAPTSTVRNPVCAAIIGPIVEPQGQSFFTMNSCTEIPTRRASSRTKNPLSALVAYRWFELDLITVPLLSRGA